MQVKIANYFQKTSHMEYRSSGPISSALDVIGDKWSLLIIRDIIFYGKNNFSEFEKSPEGISSNILADRLQMLVEERILTKHKDPTNRKRINYKITPKGVDLLPVLVEMIIWSDEYLNISNEAREFATRLNAHKDGIIKQMMREIKVTESAEIKSEV